MTLDDNKLEGVVVFEIGRWKDEKELAKRLSVYGIHNPEYPFKKDEYSWDLGGNDWWLTVEGPLARLSYRYGKAYPAEYWKALRLVVGYALHGTEN